VSVSGGACSSRAVLCGSRARQAGQPSGSPGTSDRQRRETQLRAEFLGAVDLGAGPAGGDARQQRDGLGGPQHVQPYDRGGQRMPVARQGGW
jgi:hypothetical protein